MSMTHSFTEKELTFINKTFYNYSLPCLKGKVLGFGLAKHLQKHGITTKENKKLVLSSDYKKMFDSWLHAEHVISLKNKNQEQIIALFNKDYLVIVHKTMFCITVTHTPYFNTELRSLIISELELPVDYRNNKDIEFLLSVSQDEWDTIRNLHAKNNLNEYRNDNLINTISLQTFCDVMIDGTFDTIRMYHFTGDETNEYLYVSYRDNDVFILKKSINNISTVITIGTSNVFKIIFDML